MPSIADLFATLGLDDTDFNAKLRSAKIGMVTAAEDMALPIGKTRDLLKQLTAALGPTAKGNLLDQLADQGYTARESVRLVKQAIDELKASEKQGAAEAANASARQKEIFDQQKAAVTEQLRLEKQAADQRVAIDKDARARQKELMDQQRGDYAAAARAEAEAAKVLEDANRSQIKSAEDAAKQVLAAEKAKEQAVQQTISAVNQAGSAMTRVGFITEAAFAPLALGLGIAVKSFADFDEALVTSISIMGQEGKVMKDDLSQAAIELSKNTKFSAKESAEAFYFLASAGLSAKDSIAALPVVADFATAGNLRLEKATEVLAQVQSSLGLAIKNDAVANMQEMVHVSDVLVKADTIANAKTIEFAEALINKAGPAARLYGKSIEETVAVLAVFADNGIKAQLAGNYFNIALRDLQQQANKHKNVMLEVNGETVKFADIVYDATGKTRNMADISQSLTSAFKGMSDQQIRSTLTMIGFQDRSVFAIQQLIGMADGIRNYQVELEKAGGITKTVAEQQMETFNKQVLLLKNNITDLAITIGKPLVESLNSFIGRGGIIISTLKEMGDAFSSLPPALQRIIVDGAAAAAGLGLVGGAALIAGGQFLQAGAAISQMIANWDKIAAVLPGVTEKIGVIITALGGSGGLIALIGTGFASAVTGGLIGWHLLNEQMDDLAANYDKVAKKHEDWLRLTGQKPGATATPDNPNTWAPEAPFTKSSGQQVSAGMPDFKVIVDGTDAAKKALVAATQEAMTFFGVQKKNLDVEKEMFAKLQEGYDAGLVSAAEYNAGALKFHNAEKAAVAEVTKTEHVGYEQRQFFAREFDKEVKGNEKVIEEFIKQQKDSAKLAADWDKDAAKGWADYDKAARSAAGITSDLNERWNETHVIITSLKDRLPEPILQLYDATVKARADLRGLGVDVDGLAEGLPKRIGLLTDLFHQMDAGVKVTADELESAALGAIRDMDRLAKINPAAAVAIWAELVKKLKEVSASTGALLQLDIKRLEALVKDRAERGQSATEEMKQLEEKRIQYEILIDSATRLGKVYTDIREIQRKMWDDFSHATVDAITGAKSWGDAWLGVVKKLETEILNVLVGTVFKALGDTIESKTKVMENLANVASKGIGKLLDLLHLSSGAKLATDEGGKLASQVSSATLNDILGTGGDAATSTVAATANAASAPASSAASGASGLLSTVSGVAGIAGAVASIGSGITEGILLSHISSDTGHIEVNTRGALNQLISMQGTMNTYLPQLVHLPDIWGALVGDGPMQKIADILYWGMINVHVTNGSNVIPSGTTSSGGAETLSGLDWSWSRAQLEASNKAAEGLTTVADTSQSAAQAMQDLGVASKENADAISAAADVIITATGNNATTTLTPQDDEFFAAMRQALISGTGPLQNSGFGSTSTGVAQIGNPLLGGAEGNLALTGADEGIIKEQLVKNNTGAAPGTKEYLLYQLGNGDITVDQYRSQLADIKVKDAISTLLTSRSPAAPAQGQSFDFAAETLTTPATRGEMSIGSGSIGTTTTRSPQEIDALVNQYASYLQKWEAEQAKAQADIVDSMKWENSAMAKFGDSLGSATDALTMYWKNIVEQDKKSREISNLLTVKDPVTGIPVGTHLLGAPAPSTDAYRQSLSQSSYTAPWDPFATYQPPSWLTPLPIAPPTRSIGSASMATANPVPVTFVVQPDGDAMAQALMRALSSRGVSLT